MKDDSGECTEKIGLPPEAINMGASLPGGLPYQSWAADLVKKRKTDLAKDDPHARCLPPNFPRAFSFPHMQEYVQSPRMIVILDEFNASFRQIFTDGRPLLKDPQPSWNGYSTGKWVDDFTFVDQTVGLDDRTWIDNAGRPHSDALRVEERYHRADRDHLEMTITIDDPKMYTKPWVALNRLPLRLQAPGFDIQEMECSPSETAAYNKRLGDPGSAPTGKKQDVKK